MRPAIGSKTYRQQLFEQLMRKIVFAEYQPGTELPSMGEVAASYRVSRSLVKQVFRDLEAEGVILCRNGQRALVRPQLAEHFDLALIAVGKIEAPYRDGPWRWQILQSLNRAFLAHRIPQIQVDHGAMGEVIRRCQPSGLILLPDQEHYARARTEAVLAGRPFAVIRSFVETPDCNTVSISYREAAEQIGCYFLANGVRSMVHLMQSNVIDELGLATRRNRFSEVFRLLLERQLGPEDFHFHSFSGFFDEPDAAVREHFVRLPRPIGFLVSGDFMAARVVKAGLAAGLRLKKDFLVVGGSGLPDAAHWKPALSTTRIPFDEIAEAAVEMLLRQQRERRLTVDPVAVSTGLMIHET